MPEPIRYLSPGPGLPQADAGPQIKATLAAGDVASGALDTASELGLKIKKQHEAGEIATWMAGVHEDAAEFSADLMRRHDPDQWLNDWKEKQRDWRSQVGEQKWLPGTKARVLEDLTRWGGFRTADLARQVKMRVFEEGRLRSGTALEYYASRGEEAAYYDQLRRDEEAGIYSPAEGDKLRLKGKQRFALYDWTMDARETPGMVLDQIDSEDFLKRNPGLTIADQNRLREEAKRGVVDQSHDALDKARDLMALGKLSRPDDVEMLFPHLRPAVQEKIKQEIVRRNDADVLRKQQDPVFQDQVAGQISELMSIYDPTGERPDADYVEIALLIDQLPAGPLRDEYADQLDSLRDGHQRVIDSNAKAAMKEIDEAFQAQKSRMFKRMTDVRPFMDAGLLLDWKKLRSFGFSKDQANQIAGEGKGADLSTTARNEVFRRLWYQRAEKDGAIRGREYRIAEAFAAREPAFSEVDEGALARVKAEHGRAKREMAEWLRANPNADESKIAAKLREIGVNVEAEDLLEDEFGDLMDGMVLPPRE